MVIIRNDGLVMRPYAIILIQKITILSIINVNIIPNQDFVYSMTKVLDSQEFV